MMDEKQREMWYLLCDLDAEKALGLLTDYHGLQLLDDGFYEHLISEGYIDEPEEEEEEEDEVVDADEAIRSTEDFEDFCSNYPICTGCPFENAGSEDCEELYAKRKETIT